MKIFFLVAAGLIVIAVVAQLVVAGAFGARIADLRARLLASQASAEPDPAQIPPLVREFAARNGGRVGGPRAIEMVQRAEMRLAPDQPYFAIAATQLSGTRDPGFVWEARGRMANVIPLQVVDSSVAGAGWLEARIAGSVPVASASGPETDMGEMMRFLAELPWNPDALLNAAGLNWRQLDATQVEVSAVTTGGVARVTLQFDAQGDIVGIAAADRPRAVGTGSVPTRWIGRFTGYAQRGAYRVPAHGEIAWVLPEGEFVYWRGDIVSVTPAGE